MLTPDTKVPLAEPVVISSGFRRLLLATAVLVFLLIVSGGVVRFTQAGGACQGWPGCFGVFSPPAGLSARVEYIHRAASLLSFCLAAVAALIAWRRYPAERLLRAMLGGSLGMMALQIGLGAALAQFQLPWVTALHLGFSLTILGMLLLAGVTAYFRYYQPGAAAKLSFGSPFARLSLAALGLVFVVMVSGAVLAARGENSACAGWPLCTRMIEQWRAGDWLQLSHRLAVLTSVILLGWLLVQAWRTQRSQTPVIVSTTAAVVLLMAQALLGSRLTPAAPVYLLVLHQASAAAVWAALVVQVACVGFAGRTADEERQEAARLHGRKGVVRDLLMLTKPVVVLLLLVTTYAGMVIAAADWPPAALTFWTLLGGFLAAGGSGAINQYIDRRDDLQMQRTQKRPIPSGRLTPGEGLAFGVGLTLISFYLMTAFVNFLAALLTLAGILYYTLIYSIFLKKTTVQNIVIGGGAGAIPPLVGWAAASGALNLPALLLFALVFLWTPPHFWALALVRRRDYARAGVPMLPVVRGEQETRWQIFLYTVELVVLTLFMPLLGLGGSIYFVGALMLGGWLLLAAWKVWKQGGNKVAWKMYRYSSMYLAFIFLVLMIDAVL